jgi:hypothetical protein
VLIVAQGQVASGACRTSTLQRSFYQVHKVRWYLNSSHLKKYFPALDYAPTNNTISHLQCASSIPKIPSANLLFQPHPPNTKCKLLDSLECYGEPCYISPPSQSLLTFLEGPRFKTHIESLWWNSCKVNSGSTITYRVIASGWLPCSKSIPTSSHTKPVLAGH